MTRGHLLIESAFGVGYRVYYPPPSLLVRRSPVQLVTAFINNPVKVAVGVLLLVLFGSIAVFQMPVELTPNVEQKWLSVNTIWPGAGPEEIEHEIVYQQERQLKAVPGVRYIVSSSSNSQARVSMGFNVDTDMNEALVKVNSRLQQISRYPETALEPTIYSGMDRTSEIAVFNIIPRAPSDEQLQAFMATHPHLEAELASIRALTPPTVMLQQLRQLALRHSEIRELLPSNFNVAEEMQFAEDHIAAAIGRVPGVSRVWVWGGKRPEMKVIVDPAKLAVLGLTLTDIRNTLRAGNRDAPAGQWNKGKRRFDVRVVGRYTDPEQIRREVITVIDGAPVYVEDVAEVELGFRSTLDSAATHFATECLRMGVNKEPGANVLEVMEGVKRVRDDLNEGVLQQRGLMLVQSYDDTEYVNASIGAVRGNMLLGAVLTACVLLLFLRSVPSTLIVGLAIPVSIVGTFLVLRLLGRSLNVVSLAGMTFAIGMLVDNAVVVLENIYRHHQAGASPFEAARQGTKEVWGATLASTLTTLAVFVPILFVQEESGQLFRDIALAISCGVGLSLVVSIVVIPTAAARFLSREPTTGSDASARPSRLLVSLLDRAAGGFSESVVGLNRRLQASLRLRIASLLVFVVGAIVTAVVLMPPVEYLPNGNRNSVRGRLVPPPGYNTEKLQHIGDTYYQELEAAAKQAELDNSAPKISDYTFGAYMGKGYFSAMAEEPLRAHELVPFMQQLAENIPGVEAYVNQSGLFQDGWGRSSRLIEVHIIGPDLDRLVDLAQEVRRRIGDVLPESSAYPEPSLEMGKPEMRVIPNRLRAAEAGLSAGDIGFTVDAFIDSAYADKYILQEEEIDLSLVLKNDQGADRHIADVPISTPQGEIVPLSALAKIEMTSSLESIRHINRERAITLNVTPPEGIPLADAIQRIEDDIVAPLEESGELRGLYRIAMSGTADKLRATWTALRWNFLVAILITYLLMAALFESWSYPLVIMVSLPLAAVGGIVGLRMVGLFHTQHLDIITMLGFVILIGTVVNNAILIVHQALNYIRNESLSSDEAVLKSVSTRIRPIFMTTITTTFGLLPLVMINGAGSELYRGLGSVVLGGLLVSTTFTLFLVPTLFGLMESASTFWPTRFRRKRSELLGDVEIPLPADGTPGVRV